MKSYWLAFRLEVEAENREGAERTGKQIERNKYLLAKVTNEPIKDVHYVEIDEEEGEFGGSEG